MKPYLSKLKAIDPYMFLLLMGLVTVGLVSLYSAAGGSLTPWALRQFYRFLISLSIFIALTLLDVRTIRDAAYPLYGASLLLLIIVEIFGHIGMGAQRWIDLGLIKLQPSEIVKVTLLLALARYFYNFNEQDRLTLRSYIAPCLLIALPSALLLRQPDLGTMLILAATGASMIFLAGIRLWKVITVITLVLGSLPVLWLNMHDYQKRRVETFLNPEADPLGAGYHIMQSKIAIGSGGYFGRGLTGGTQSQLQFLPEKQTDFVFAHFCEEFGFFGGVALILAYCFLIIVCLRVGYECRSFFSRLYAMGFSMLLFLYIFVNMGMVMGLLPVVGVPLPFISYGGTSMLSLFFGFGILSSCYIHRSLRFGTSF